MKHQLISNLIAPALAIGFGLLPVARAADVESRDWSEATPAQIHQQLAQSKAAALADRRMYDAMMAQASPASDQTDYDVTFYDISLQVDDTTEWLYGVVTIVAEATVDDVDEIDVDFQADMTVDSIVSSDGPRVYSRLGDVLTITLNEPIDTGDEFWVTVYYQGHPTEGGFQGFSFDTRSGIPVISSLSEPYFARSWWPCKDRMDDKADSFNIAVTVDTTFYCGSNGTLDSTVDHGDNTHTFYYRVRYPMVTYLFSVAISDYEVWYDVWPYNFAQDTMLVVHAVYPDMYSYSLGKYDITPDAITVFSDNYGRYPFVEEKYGHSNFEWGGAMEHQTMSSMAGSTFGFSEAVVVHELSHQWWGDMITCESWADIWLNEGWASYSEALWFYETQGFEAYRDYMNGMAYAGGGTIYVEDTTSVWGIFDGGLSYDKGAWVVHMLRGMLGDSLFFEAVDAYYNSEHQWGAATTDEFRDTWEAATGWELDWYFDNWIHGTYRPYYRYQLYQEVSDSGGIDAYLYVRQTQTTQPEVFGMPVQFVFDFEGLPSDSVVLWCNERTKLFRFNYDQEIYYVDCDPNDWVLKYASSESWQLHFLTFNEDLGTATAFQPYSFAFEAHGGSGTFTYSHTGGTLPPGLSVDEDGVLSGTPTDSGIYTFTLLVDDDYTSYAEEKEFSLTVEGPELIPGDVDLSFEPVNVADLIFLVTYMFQQGPAPVVLNLADIDGTCTVDIADLVGLVDYMFHEGPDLVMGCVE